MIKRPWIYLATFLIYLAPTVGWSQFLDTAEAGRVIFFKGGAFAQRVEKSRNLVLGARVYVNDRIRTGNGARVALEMNDGAIISLGGGTDFLIRSYSYGSGKGSALLELAKGAFRIISGAIGKLPGRDFRVRTPVATIGIRGTDFWGGFEFSEALDVALLSGGGIYVENKAGRIDIDTPGLGTTVQNTNTPPSPAKSWPAEKVNRAVLATAWGR